MVQFSSFFNAVSKKISNKSGNKTSHGLGNEAAACQMAKEAKKNELLLSSCGVIDTVKSNNLAAGYSKRGNKGFNQDTFLVWEEFGCQEDMMFCGVFDGHGPWGHVVSKRVRELMPQSLLCSWQESVAAQHSLGDDHVDSMFDIWKKSYINTCASVDRQLQRQSGIDSFYSGTTALTIVKQGELMVVANVGDSRAVLATTSNDGSLVATQLTTDLKPNLLHERKRIAESRGRVHACPDEPGTYRVWMPRGETQQGPGLALSRAFGDYFIKDFGLISEPEVTQRKISSRDQFAILATDGVWDVMSNQEAVNIVGTTTERGESAKRLVQCAVSAWKRKGRAASMDDISAICLFLHPTATYHQESEYIK